MKKKEYKVGDIIKVSRQKFADVNDRLIGTRAALEAISVAHGRAHRDLWELFQEIYPDIYRKYHVSYGNYEIEIKEVKS